MLIPLQADGSRCGLPNGMPEIGPKKALETMITQGLEAVKWPLRLGKNLAFAVVPAEDEDKHVLHPDETRLLSPRAARKRQLSLTLGRAAARLALRQLGLDGPPPVLRGNAGEPIWPDGISGSISHCHPWSVAVVARPSGPIAIGIDLESLDRFRDLDIIPIVCRNPEREWVCGDGDCRERLAMIFSAKEAIYKSLYPLHRRYIDFAEIELSWSPQRSCFQAEVLPLDVHLAEGNLCGIQVRRHNHLIFSYSVYGT